MTSDGESGLPALSGKDLRFSIVIANYNYARFVARAIESALDQDWPAIEVIVVDDGSTDDSASVIGKYAARVASIFQDNAGQRAANNVGFAAATGDVIVFLDADDVLRPGFAKSVAAAWRPGTSKVQVQIARVGPDEQPLGSLLPDIRFTPTSDEIRHWADTTGEYPTPPGSGNAYARDFLERFFPIGPEHDAFTDSTCLALAPYLGKVVTVLQPLVSYRQHGTNDSNLLAAPTRFGREVDRAIRRQKSARAICLEQGVAAPTLDCLRLGRHLLQLRVASLRMAPGAHPMPGDSRLAALGDALRSLGAHGFESPGRRIQIAAWSIVALFAPLPLASRMIRWRFARN